MTEAERDRWDRRYRELEADDPLRRPSGLLREWADAFPTGGRALDVATGLGRNARFLAGLGMRVDAIDISPVGLEEAEARAPADAAIDWIETDLGDWDPEPGVYGVIACSWWLDREALPRILDGLAPRGLVLWEQHLRTDEPGVRGPAPHSPHRVRPNELLRLLGHLRILFYEEGTVEADGKRTARARIVGRRTR